MSHRMYVAVVSLGSASLGLLAASITLHAAGCGPNAEDLFNTPGRCVASPNDTSPKCVCSTAADCPKATECMEWMCDNTNHCKADPKTGTLPVAKQLPGDCKQVKCEGGERKTVKDNGDLPVDHDVCMSATCMDGEPHQAPQGAGTVCSEGQSEVCDGMGNCVHCLENTNDGCGAGDVCLNPDGGGLKCVPGHCLDGATNDGETDNDCGGTCKPCGLGSDCSKDSDCSNQICAPGLGSSKVCCDVLCTGACRFCVQGTGKCEDAPTATFDTDCAQPKVCAKGAGCAFMASHTCTKNDDCISGNCDSNMQCAPGIKNAPCISNFDCINFNCDLTTHFCQ